MGKDKIINLRIRREDAKKIKDLGFKFSDCWQLGVEKILENEREELVKLDKKYYDLYTHVHTKLENFGKTNDEKIPILDELYEWYEKRGTSIDEPTSNDNDTVKFQLTKKGIPYTVPQVFEYWKKRVSGIYFFRRKIVRELFDKY